VGPFAALIGWACSIFRGQRQIGEPGPGVKIERFSLGERICIGYGLLFIIMAVTGLSLLSDGSR